MRAMAWLLKKKKNKICKFSERKEMDQDYMSCSAKDQKMPKLSSQMLQRQEKKSRKKTQLAGEDMRAMAWLLKKITEKSAQKTNPSKGMRRC